MMKFMVSLMVIGACILGGTQAAIFGLNRAFPALSKQDLKLLMTTAREEMTGKPEGTVLEWKNPKSGAAGTVTLIKRYWNNGQECRNIVHDFKVVGAERWHYKSTICRQSDGSWKDHEARF
jgi:surface antigen